MVEQGAATARALASGSIPRPKTPGAPPPPPPPPPPPGPQPIPGVAPGGAPPLASALAPPGAGGALPGGGGGGYQGGVAPERLAPLVQHAPCFVLLDFRWAGSRAGGGCGVLVREGGVLVPASWEPCMCMRLEA
jgi:hypothetical protein